MRLSDAQWRLLDIACDPSKHADRHVKNGVWIAVYGPSEHKSARALESRLLIFFDRGFMRATALGRIAYEEVSRTLR